MAKEKKPTSNQRIDRLIVESNWQIEPKWAIGKAKQYANELELIESGVSISEIGYAERRAKQRPQYYAITGQRIQQITSEDHFEEEEEGPEKIGKVAVLSLTGVMQTQDSLSTRGISTLCQDIRSCNADSSIGAIVLKVESGGGMSLAGQMLQGAIQDSQLPVVVHADFMASAAVRGTLQADHIMAAGPGTEVGSIGSMISIDKWWAKYYANNYDDLYSRKSRDKNREWREYLKGNKGPLIDSATKDDEIFMQEVVEARPLRGDTGKTLRGGMFYAKEALERGLVDSIGTFSEAIIRAAVLGELHKNQNQNLTTMKKQLIQFLNNFFAWELPENATQDEVIGQFAGLEPMKEQLEVAKAQGRQEAQAEMDDRIKNLEQQLADMKAQSTTTVEEAPVEVAQATPAAAPATNEASVAVEAQEEEENPILAKLAAFEAKMTNLEAANQQLKEANDKLKRQAASDKIADEFTSNSTTPKTNLPDTETAFASAVEFDYQFPAQGKDD